MSENTADSAVCPECTGSSLRVANRTATATTKSGTAVEFLDEWTVCESCGEEYFTYEQSLAHSRARTNALRKAEGLFSPEEIRAIRLRLRMTQEAFELALGVGRKTVVRWERGTVPPSKAANGLLWFALHYSWAFLEYATERAPEAELRCETSARLESVLASIGSDGESGTLVMSKTLDSAKVFELAANGSANPPVMTTES